MVSKSNILHGKRIRKYFADFQYWKLTLKIGILQSLRKISTRCIAGFMLNSYKKSWMVSTRGTPAQGTPHHEVFGAKQRGHPSLEFTLTGFCIELWLYVKLAFLRYQVYQYLDSNIISILTLNFSSNIP